MASTIIITKNIPEAMTTVINTALDYLYAKAVYNAINAGQRKALAKIETVVNQAEQKNGRFIATVDGQKLDVTHLRDTLTNEQDAADKEAAAIIGHINTILYGRKATKKAPAIEGLSDKVGLDFDTAVILAKGSTGQRTDTIKNILALFGIENLKTALYRAEVDHIAKVIGGRTAKFTDVKAGKALTTEQSAKAVVEVVFSALMEVLTRGGAGYGRLHSDKDHTATFEVTEDGKVTITVTDGEQPDRTPTAAEIEFKALKAAAAQARAEAAKAKAAKEAEEEAAKEAAAQAKEKEQAKRKAEQAAKNAAKRAKSAKEAAEQAEAAAQAATEAAKAAEQAAKVEPTIENKDKATTAAKAAKAATAKAKEKAKAAKEAEAKAGQAAKAAKNA